MRHSELKLDCLLFPGNLTFASSHISNSPASYDEAGNEIYDDKVNCVFYRLGSKIFLQFKTKFTSMADCSTVQLQINRVFVFDLQVR